MNLIEEYLDYKAKTESPTIFHRWSIIGSLAALLGRNCYTPFGDKKIFPNFYTMLIGEAGSRKSTAIISAGDLLRDIDYKTFAPEKTTKEKFLLDLEAGFDKIEDETDERMDVTKSKHNPTMRFLFGKKEDDSEPSEVFVDADEFTVFMGHNNVEFIDLLTKLWDYDRIYRNRIKNGASVRIPYPTVNILSATTNSKLNIAMPPAVISDGFFSRFVLVFSEPTDIRIARPKPGDPFLKSKILEQLSLIRTSMIGEMPLKNGAGEAFDEIYNNWKGLEDSRFVSYSSRRHIHLLKLCMVCAAANGEMEISIDTIIYANTILHYTEHFMPNALGEFGKARDSDVSAKILDLVTRSERPLDPMKDIWPDVRRDIDGHRKFLEVLRGLQSAGKIQQIAGGQIIPCKTMMKRDVCFCNMGLLREYVDGQAKDGLPL